MKIEKLYENHMGGTYNKFYRTNDFNYLDLARLIEKSEIELLYVDVDEGVERDMQSVSRNYGLKEFMNMSGYIESAAYDIKHLSFNFLGSLRGKTVMISIGATDHTIISLYSYEDLEIEDILPIGEDQ